MKVIGFRAKPKEIRYAILETTALGISFVNKADNKLKYPADAESAEDKILWVYKELGRILEEHQNIEAIAIKINEYAGVESAAKRDTTYVDSIVMLVAKQKNIPVARFLYANLRQNSSSVQTFAQQLVGKTDKYWDTAIADAIAAANKVIQEK